MHDSDMNTGFARVAAAVPQCRVADIDFNCQHILELWQRADSEDVAVAVFPELALTGYTVRDLFLDELLLTRSAEALTKLAEAGDHLQTMAIVGVALRIGTGVYNCAAVLHGGRILGVTPKAYLPNYREFEEARWFRPGLEVSEGSMASIAGQTVPFGMDLLYQDETQPDLIVEWKFARTTGFMLHHPLDRFRPAQTSSAIYLHQTLWSVKPRLDVYSLGHIRIVVSAPMCMLQPDQVNLPQTWPLMPMPSSVKMERFWWSQSVFLETTN